MREKRKEKSSSCHVETLRLERSWSSQPEVSTSFPFLLFSGHAAIVPCPFTGGVIPENIKTKEKVLAHNFFSPFIFSGRQKIKERKKLYGEQSLSFSLTGPTQLDCVCGPVSEKGQWESVSVMKWHRFATHAFLFFSLFLLGQSRINHLLAMKKNKEKKSNQGLIPENERVIAFSFLRGQVLDLWSRYTVQSPRWMARSMRNDFRRSRSPVLFSFSFLWMGTQVETLCASIQSKEKEVLRTKDRLAVTLLFFFTVPA